MIYRGTPGSRAVTVDGRRLSPTASQRLYNHSPDGFAWGYGGYGAAQLALALLLDATEDRGVALRLYQQFKWLVVAFWPCGANWEISSDDILGWVRSQLAGDTPAEAAP